MKSIFTFRGFSHIVNCKFFSGIFFMPNCMEGRPIYMNMIRIKINFCNVWMFYTVQLDLFETTNECFAGFVNICSVAFRPGFKNINLTIGSCIKIKSCKSVK